MIDPQAKPKSYLKLMLLIALLGIVSAVVTFLFIALVNQGIDLIWQQAATTLGLDLRLFTFLACTLGGLLVGLLASFAVRIQYRTGFWCFVVCSLVYRIQTATTTGIHG